MDIFEESIRSETIRKRVKKIWDDKKSFPTETQKAFSDFCDKLSEEERKIAQDCWDKLEKEYGEK